MDHSFAAEPVQSKQAHVAPTLDAISGSLGTANKLSKLRSK